MRVARLCNAHPWEVDELPGEIYREYLELLNAVDAANREITQENVARAKRSETTGHRRITLAD